MKARTLCDFGTPVRRTCLTEHKSLETARRQWKRIIRNYGPSSPCGRQSQWRCWQEASDGTIINDTAVA